MKIKFIILALFILALPYVSQAQGLTFDEQVYDFGHVGIDFGIKNEFIFINRTDVPIQINDIEVSCDCSSVVTADTLVLPGDTAFFRLTFETKDYYGPINKSFIVSTDHPKLPELKYFYLSIVGQWFNGLKPNPISLFFLPSKKSQIVKIPNLRFDKTELIKHIRNDNTIDVEVVKSLALINESIELKISPNKNLKTGKFKTNITIHIGNDDNEEVILTIPIKIVKY